MYCDLCTEYLQEQSQRRQSLLQLQLTQVNQYQLERVRLQHRKETSDLNRVLNANKNERVQNRRRQIEREQRLCNIVFYLLIHYLLKLIIIYSSFF